MSGGDFYIVTTRKYRRFATVEEAKAQRAKFLARFPSIETTVIRCKHKLARANHYQAMVALLKAFVHQGATGDNLERARTLLAAVKARHPEGSV